MRIADRRGRRRARGRLLRRAEERGRRRRCMYRIDAPRLAAGAPLAADLSVVGRAHWRPGSTATGIATRWPGQRLDYLAGARWAERAVRRSRVGAGRGAPGLGPAALGAGRLRPLPRDAHAGRRGAPLRGGLHRRRSAGRAGRARGDARAHFGPARARVVHGRGERERGGEPRRRRSWPRSMRRSARRDGSCREESFDAIAADAEGRSGADAAAAQAFREHRPVARTRRGSARAGAARKSSAVIGSPNRRPWP